MKFVVQQYVRIDKDKYALADLYLPQLNIFIEINEPFHENNIERDKLRNEKIMDITHSALCTIVCGTKTEDQDGKEVIHWKPLDEIHRQITEVVSLIKQRISELGENFKPWDDVSTLSVEYHRNKGYLRVEDNECLRTVDDVAAVFGTKPKHRGFLRASGAGVPNKKGWIIWWPNTNHTRLCNKTSPDGMYIYEYPTKENNSVTQTEHIKQWIAAPEETRVTFLRSEDDLGFCFYRFVGVFRLNRDKSIQENKCVWERISDTYQLNV